MNTSTLKFPLIFAMLCLVAGLTACNHYNPFSDVTNADIEIVAESFESEDTVSIFTTQQLSFRLLVKELLSQIEVVSPGNRLWTDTIIGASQFASETFTLDFSWSDTGMHAITILARTGQDVKRRDFFVYTRSPLHQDSIRGHRGEMIQLRTDPVADRDAGYYWSLGNATHYFSQHCSIQVALTTPLIEGVGKLWVSDGTNSSPADSFFFSVSDTVAPLITCLSLEDDHTDTVFTGNPFFTFRVSIADQEGSAVDSASINGAAFDREDGTIYTAILEDMEQYNLTPLALEIYALDRFAYGNESRDTFYVKYIDSLPQANPVNITVMAPGKDTTTVGSGTYEVFGICENSSPSSFPVTLLAYVNDSIPVQPLVIRESHAFWEWSLPLAPGYNSVRIVATDHETGALLDRAGFSLRYVPDVADSSAPQIAAITANGAQANNLYTTRSSVRIGVKAFDEHGFIDTLSINQTNVSPDTTQSSWYYRDIPLEHTPGGNEIVIRAVDTKGNENVATAIIFRNRRPLVESRPQPAFILIDTLFTDTIQAFDPDGDSLHIEKQHGPTDLIITPQGAVFWLPSEQDTGTHTVTVRIWDGFQPVYESFTLVVSESIELQPGPIQFATRAEDFPAYLELGVDTLHMPLRIREAAGVAPWKFTTRLLRNDSLVQNATSDSIIRWVPGIADTGSQQLVVTVTDIFPSSDTLYPRILVVDGNNPCSLSVNFRGEIREDGTFDLNAGQKPDTLIFKINDRDPRVIERYSLSIYQARSRLYSSIDSALVDTLALVFDPEAFDGYDTVVVTVKDRKHNTDTLRQTLYYGMPPEFEESFFPPDQANIGDDEVTFSWSASDRDGDFIWYELFVGKDGEAPKRIASTPDTSVSVSDLESGAGYSWYVKAHDWKSATTSPLRVLIRP